MPVNRASLLHLLNNHPNLTDEASKHNNAKDPLRITLNDTKRKVEREIVKEALEYTLWNDLWNKYGTFGVKKDVMDKRPAKDRYSRGQKVFVNFGYNVGREASMPHPAIILKNFKHLAIVVPTTTDDGADLGELKDLVISCPKDGNVFPGDDIIEIHQVRCIGKNRILNDLGKNVKDYIVPNNEIDKQNEIIKNRITGTLGVKLTHSVLSYGMDLRTVLDVMLNFHYTPDSFESLIELQKNFEKLELDLANVKAELETYKSGKQAAPEKE